MGLHLTCASPHTACCRGFSGGGASHQKDWPALPTWRQLSAAWLGTGREGLPAQPSGRMGHLPSTCPLPSIPCSRLMSTGHRQFLLGSRSDAWAMDRPMLPEVSVT